MKLFIIFILSILNISAFEIKENNIVSNIEFESEGMVYITSNNLRFKDSSNILIKFNNENYENINAFEQKYDLELKNVLISGYYVYKSNENILEIVSNISKEENIKTVKPNWYKLQRKR